MTSLQIKKEIPSFDTESSLVSLERKNSYLLEKACQLLQINPNKRTQEEINLLIKAFENNTYFKSNYSNNFSYKGFIKMCTDHLKYEYLEAGSSVCHYGEIGEKFYIILKGSIDCFILRTEEELNRDIQELTKPREIADMINQTESFQSELKILKTKLVQYNQNLTEIKLKKGLTMMIQREILDLFNEIHSMNPKYYADVEVLRNDPTKIDMYFYQNFCRFKKIRTLYTGAYFGEIALTLSKPRIATITARENLHLASLNKEDYNKIFENQIEEMNQKMRCFLSQFNSFSKDAIIKFTYDFKSINFHSHQSIFKQGDDANLVFLVKSGCVKLFKELENDNKTSKYSLDFNPNLIRQKKREDKRQILIALIIQNEFFGEDDVIKKIKRSYTAVATQYTEMYYITSEVLNGIKKNQKEFYDIIREKAAIKDKWKNERIANLEHAPKNLRPIKRKKNLSLGLRSIEGINPQTLGKKNNSNITNVSSKNLDPSIKVETIRGSTHTKIFSVTKDKIDIYEKFQSQNPNFKYKKLSLEMINHIVKKNSKMLKVNLFYNTSNEKNMLFEYFRNNKYQENYLRARLSTQKNNKTHEIGMPQNNPNHFMSTQTLNFLKQLKSKNNSQIEEELLEKQEKENEQKTILDQKGEQKEQRLCLNPFTVINPYNLSYTQESSFSEKEIESVNSGNTNFGKQIISSKHNMFRMKPKNISVMKNHYKF